MIFYLQILLLCIMLVIVGFVNNFVFFVLQILCVCREETNANCVCL
jgi:hypothetical protein